MTRDGGGSSVTEATACFSFLLAVIVTRVISVTSCIWATTMPWRLSSVVTQAGTVTDGESLDSAKASPERPWAKRWTSKVEDGPT